MRITTTQMIAHYYVNFDLIHKSFILLVFNNCIVSYRNIFQAIAPVVMLVGMAKNGKQFVSNICVDFFNHYKLQLLK